MKKTKLLVVVLALSIIVMGAGYAYWTQDLNITSTVSTGDLKVEFVPLEQGLYNWDDLIYEGLVPNNGEYEPSFWANYMDVDLNLASGKLVANFEDIYPGAGGFLRFRIANTGTVPAKVTGVTGTSHGANATLLDNFDYRVHSLRIYTPKVGVNFEGIDWSNWPPTPIYSYFDYIDLSFPNGLDIIEAEDFATFTSELTTLLSSVTLQPYGFMEINGEGTGYDILLPSDIDDNDLMESKDEIGFNLDIEFTQGE